MPVIKQLITPDFAAYHADTIELSRDLPSESVDFSVFSPPFESLYTYSASERDMGNCRDSSEFFEHYQFLIKEQFRVMRPGRCIAIHCMLLPTSKAHHGFIGLRDFRGDIIRAYEKEGFIFHSEVTIWKDPVTAMQRTKALGLLWKTIKKDSAMSRMGVPDYVVTMRKPGENKSPISHTAEEFPVTMWQAWASPVWMDIDPGETLQYQSAREHDDERHIAPLQLGVIRRCIGLWSKPGDLVWSPFMGIGSEGHVALQMGRRFIGAELKESYFGQAIKNLQAAKGVQHDLFEAAVTPAFEKILKSLEPGEVVRDNYGAGLETLEQANIRVAVEVLGKDPLIGAKIVGGATVKKAQAKTAKPAKKKAAKEAKR